MLTVFDQETIMESAPTGRRVATSIIYQSHDGHEADPVTPVKQNSIISTSTGPKRVVQVDIGFSPSRLAKYLLASATKTFRTIKHFVLGQTPNAQETPAGRAITPGLAVGAEIPPPAGLAAAERVVSVEASPSARANTVNSRLQSFLLHLESEKDVTEDFEKLIEAAKERSRQIFPGNPEQYLTVITDAFKGHWTHDETNMNPSLDRANRLISVLCKAAIFHRLNKSCNASDVKLLLMRLLQHTEEEIKNLTREIEKKKDNQLEIGKLVEFHRYRNAAELVTKEYKKTDPQELAEANTFYSTIPEDYRHLLKVKRPV
jgi:hypothetical protein